tara:strand:+ start:7980 stop:8819 length:840 start_codon:yes stop_codon:yes gene_type:complete
MAGTNLKKNKKKRKGNSRKNKSTFFRNISLPNLNEQVTEQRLEFLKGKIGGTTHTLGENERIIESVGVVKNTNDFVFEDGTKVEVGTPYHIHLNDFTKVEVYMTENKHQVNSKTIYRMVGDTTFGEYKKVKPFKTKQQYAKPFVWTISKKDIKKGFAYRYFVRELFGRRSMFEVNEVDGESKLPMYETLIIKWFVGENKELVENMNLKELDIARQQGFDLIDRVSPLSGFIGETNIIENRVRKMSSATQNLQQQVQEQSMTRDVSTETSNDVSGGGGAY